MREGPRANVVAPLNLATNLSSIRAGSFVLEGDQLEVLHARRPQRSETNASSGEHELPDEHEHDELGTLGSLSEAQPP